jgi:hypothetical protein
MREGNEIEVKQVKPKNLSETENHVLDKFIDSIDETIDKKWQIH